MKRLPAHVPAPFIREALLEWARASAAGELKKLLWVDISADPTTDPYRVRRTRKGRMVFRQGRYGRALPPSMLGLMVRAEIRGGATFLQALTLAFAEPEWMVRSRALLWTELTPVPPLLARMVEAYGISGEVHRGDPDRLVRLRARLPAWHKRRGEVGEALRLLAEALHERPNERLSGHNAPMTPPPGVAGLLPGPTADDLEEPTAAADPAVVEDAPAPELAEDDGDATTMDGQGVTTELPTDETAVVPVEAVAQPVTPRPAAAIQSHHLIGEVMSCRSLDWWSRRAPRDNSQPDLRVEAGLLRFQPRVGQPFHLVREDVRVGWTIGQALSPLAPRLLPPWACYRIVAAPSETS